MIQGHAAQHVIDYTLAGWGAAIFLNIIPAASGVLALVLLVIRIGVGVQEWRINRRKLDEAAKALVKDAGQCSAD